MNTETTNGAVNAVETVATPVKRGRKRNPDITRPIFLNADNTPRKQGAPKPGTTVKVVYVQNSVKNSEFVYGTTPVVKEEMVTVKPRTYKRANVTVATTATTTETPMPDMEQVTPVVPGTVAA